MTLFPVISHFPVFFQQHWRSSDAAWIYTKDAAAGPDVVPAGPCMQSRLSGPHGRRCSTGERWRANGRRELNLIQHTSQSMFYVLNN